MTSRRNDPDSTKLVFVQLFGRLPLVAFWCSGYLDAFVWAYQREQRLCVDGPLHNAGCTIAKHLDTTNTFRMPFMNTGSLLWWSLPLLEGWWWIRRLIRVAQEHFNLKVG